MTEQISTLAGLAASIGFFGTYKKATLIRMALLGAEWDLNPRPLEPQSSALTN